jgi:hypothetical protein
MEKCHNLESNRLVSAGRASKIYFWHSLLHLVTILSQLSFRIASGTAGPQNQGTDAASPPDRLAMEASKSPEIESFTVRTEPSPANAWN